MKDVDLCESHHFFEVRVCSLKQSIIDISFLSEFCSTCFFWEFNSTWGMCRQWWEFDREFVPQWIAPWRRFKHLQLRNEKRAPGCSFRMPVRARSGVPTYHRYFRYLLFFFFFLIQGAFFWVGVGWGGDVNVSCTCTHNWCYAIGCFLHLHTYLMLRHRMCLVGLGWGGDVNVPCTCTHTWCYVIGCFLWGWGGDVNVPCTCTHVRCYAIGCFLHLHTYLMLRHRMFLVGLGWGGDVNVPCTCTHTWCYAIGCSLHLHTYLMLRHRMFLALAHILDATS